MGDICYKVMARYRLQLFTITAWSWDNRKSFVTKTTGGAQMIIRTPRLPHRKSHGTVYAIYPHRARRPPPVRTVIAEHRAACVTT